MRLLFFRRLSHYVAFLIAVSTTPLIYRTDATEWHEISANDDECMNALEHVFSRPLVDLKDPANLFANAYGMDEPDEEFVCTFLVSLFSVCVCLEGGRSVCLL